MNVQVRGTTRVVDASKGPGCGYTGALSAPYLHASAPPPPPGAPSMHPPTFLPPSLAAVLSYSGCTYGHAPGCTCRIHTAAQWGCATTPSGQPATLDCSCRFSCRPANGCGCGSAELASFGQPSLRGGEWHTARCRCFTRAAPRAMPTYPCPMNNSPFLIRVEDHQECHLQVTKPQLTRTVLFALSLEME